MPKYSVTIVEEIVETREYEVEADTHEEAAMEARALWIDGGVDPEGGVSCEVSERDYEVFGDGLVENFSEGDLLGDIG